MTRALIAVTSAAFMRSTSSQGRPASRRMFACPRWRSDVNQITPASSVVAPLGASYQHHGASSQASTIVRSLPGHLV